MIAKGINNVVNNLMYTERGKIILSIIFGLGLATLFREFCKGKQCYRFKGPSQKELKNNIFSFDSNNTKCYMVNEENIKCGSLKKTVKFANEVDFEF